MADYFDDQEEGERNARRPYFEVELRNVQETIRNLENYDYSKFKNRTALEEKLDDFYGEGPSDIKRQLENAYRRQRELLGQLGRNAPSPRTTVMPQQQQQQHRSVPQQQTADDPYDTWYNWKEENPVDWMKIKMFIKGRTADGVYRDSDKELAYKYFEYLKIPLTESFLKEQLSVSVRKMAFKARSAVAKSGEPPQKRARAEAALIEHKGNVRLAAAVLARGPF